MLAILARTERKRSFACACNAAMFIVLMLGAVSCGGGTSGGSGSSGAGTPHISETGVVMVTATGGAIVNSVSIAVTVP
jgi:hypothetical protein